MVTVVSQSQLAARLGIQPEHTYCHMGPVLAAPVRRCLPFHDFTVSDRPRRAFSQAGYEALEFRLSDSLIFWANSSGSNGFWINVIFLSDNNRFSTSASSE